MTGAVQGVGFRPFVHRLAASEQLGGFVRNTGAGVSLEVEGPPEAFEAVSGPARCGDQATGRYPWAAAPLGSGPGRNVTFVIAPSTVADRRSAVVLPDLATCSDCLKEIFDPDDRRYRYPFTTCVHCGPRYSIIEALPYDRARTAMRGFPMCAACQAEYDDPGSRRFHAETNACPDCGPQIRYGTRRETHWRPGIRPSTMRSTRCATAGSSLSKDLAGSSCSSTRATSAAVRRLRDRKERPAKPFALMVPTFADAAAIAHISPEEKQLLCSAAAPIVLLRARSDSTRDRAQSSRRRIRGSASCCPIRRCIIS